MASELDELRAVVDDRLRRLNTALPGRIESYDASTRKAEVQPLVKEKYADGTILTLPRISGVPVVMPTTGSAGVALPIANGDPVLILFAQRSIDRWLTNGGVQEANDTRMHALSDAIAIAGLFDFTASHSDGSGLRVYNDDGEISVEASEDLSQSAGGAATIAAGSVLPGTFKAEDGTVAMGTSTVEVIDEITKALDEIATGLAAIPSPNVATLAASAALKTIKGSI